MTCKQCKYIDACMAEVNSLGQVFDPNYDGEHRCTDFVPFTNADRIRGMNDEELVKFLCCIGWKLSKQKECLEWLKRPACERNFTPTTSKDSRDKAANLAIGYRICSED